MENDTAKCLFIEKEKRRKIQLRLFFYAWIPKDNLYSHHGAVWNADGDHHPDLDGISAGF